MEILREMLGFEGWRKWPLKVSVLDEDVAKVWAKVGKKEGIREISWSIVGEEIDEIETEDGDGNGNGSIIQERKRDLNLKKLMTLDLNDGILLLYKQC